MKSEKKSFVEIFMDGAYKGWTMGIRSMLTALVLAYALMYCHYTADRGADEQAWRCSGCSCSV